MKTLYKGIYSGCPIELAPTGYLLWCLENDFMENIQLDIYHQLKNRKLSLDSGLSAMPQPMSIESWMTFSWFELWDDDVRQKFMSMVENDSKFLTPTHKRFTDYYMNIQLKLSVYETRVDVGDYASITIPVKETEYQQHYNTFYELFERK